MYEFITDYKKPVHNIRKRFEDYMRNSGLDSVVLGVSGGMDSALVALLIYPICKKYNIKIIGRYLPIITNKADETKRAIQLGKILCDDFAIVDLKKYYNRFKEICGSEKDSLKKKIREGNIKARTRMIYLYDLAQANNGLVLGTDNHSEELLGFWTLHGDVGDLSIIQRLWKTEVYRMTYHIMKTDLFLDEYSLGLEVNKSLCSVLRECINAIPTDGLGITESDFAQIGVGSYRDIDEALYGRVYNTMGIHRVNHGVSKRYEDTKYKRDNPHIIKREEILE
jgi:NAD+ synthetase